MICKLFKLTGSILAAVPQFFCLWHSDPPLSVAEFPITWFPLSPKILIPKLQLGEHLMSQSYFPPCITLAGIAQWQNLESIKKTEDKKWEGALVSGVWDSQLDFSAPSAWVASLLHGGGQPVPQPDQQCTDLCTISSEGLQSLHTQLVGLFKFCCTHFSVTTLESFSPLLFCKITFWSITCRLHQCICMLYKGWNVLDGQVINKGAFFHKLVPNFTNIKISK